MSSNVAETLFDKVDSALATYVFDGSTNIINYIEPIFTSLILLWVVIWGYMVMYGRTNDTLSTGAFKVMQIGFILTIALTASTYNTYVADVLINLPNHLGAVITNSPGYSTGQSIDSLFNGVFDAAENAWDKGGVLSGDFGMYLMAAVIGFFGIGLAVIASGLILLSKIALAVVLVIGPIAMIMLLFQPTQKFFESWLGMAINLVLVYILALAVAAIVLSLAESFVSNNEEASLQNSLALGFVFGLSMIVMRQVEPIASALGGGIALSTNGGIRQGLSKMRPSNVSRQTQKIKNDVSSTRRGAARAGNMAAAPVTSARTAYSAYQRKFGKGNSISG
jgi:type IV secretion system protein VirB6